MEELKDNFVRLSEKIRSCSEESKFNQQVQLIAVSKTHASDKIRYLYHLGQRDFAENYAQELISKTLELADLDIAWHFIGAIQSNKIKHIATKASWVHSLEKVDHVLALNKARGSELGKLKVLIEVNLSSQKHKHGLTKLDEILPLAKLIIQQPNLEFRGLMGIASNTSNSNLIQLEFQHLKQLFDKLQQQGYAIDTLSMGMSSDYELAIASGATQVRIGSLIFGVRNYAQ
jgi:pyridoxal phosphate enzyme (YggS family)